MMKRSPAEEHLRSAARAEGCQRGEGLLRDSPGQFDFPTDRAAVFEGPWIPSELKDVVQVFFGCP